MNINKEKRPYSAPLVERVELDNEISLVLQSYDSNPLEGPEEEELSQVYFNNNPYNANPG